MKHPQKWLDQYGLAPQKGFGQNFLTSSHWAEKLCAPILASPSDAIWEIGPGLGALTEILLTQGKAPLTVFEIDWGIIRYLKENFPSLHIEEGDVLEKDFAAIAQGKKIALVSNLPYNISSAVFFKLVEFRRNLSCMVLTFQKEFAERLIAEPGNKIYGATSVLAQFCFEMQSLGNLPNSAFHPMPDVVSKALVFRAAPERPVPYEDLERVVKAAFRQRRKKISGNLNSYHPGPDWKSTFEKTGLDPQSRAETLSLQDYIRLVKEIL